jgi:hypothetical protein
MYKQSQLFNGIDPQPRKIVKAPVDTIGYPSGYGNHAETNTSSMVAWSQDPNWQDAKKPHKSPYTGKRYIMGNTLRPAFTPTNFIGIKEIRDRKVVDLSDRITCGLDKLFTSKPKLTQDQLIHHPPNPYRFWG